MSSLLSWMSASVDDGGGNGVAGMDEGVANALKFSSTQGYMAASAYSLYAFVSALECTNHHTCGQTSQLTKAMFC
jgi:hypothetical protein